MTDKEKVIQFLTELGVGFVDDEGDIRCAEGMSKVAGYSTFYTQFSFDDDGSFISIGAYE